MNNRRKLSLLVSLAWRISPAYVCLLTLLTLLSGTQVLLNAVLPKFLMDELVGPRSPLRLLLWGGCIVAANAGFALLNNGGKRYLDEKNVMISERMQHVMAQKIMKVPYACLETPHDLDLKERAVFAIRNQNTLMNLLRQGADLLKHAVTLAGLLALLLTLSPGLVGVLLVVVAAGFLLSADMTRKQLRFTQSIIPTNRCLGYYAGLCYTGKVQKDARLYGMRELMIDKVVGYNREINDRFQSFYDRQGRVLGLYGILNDLQSALAYGYVGLRAFTDRLGPRIGIGSFTMYVSAIVSFARSSMELGACVTRLLQFLGYLDPFAEFMGLPEEADQGGHEPFEGPVESIRFENVSFRYPGSETLVLRNVSFELRKGEKISIVGLNGAGKTTLVKLLCRLYRPCEGVISVNGRNILDYDHDQYMRRIAAVFQDYKLFAFSVEENVCCAEPGSDRQGVRRVLGQVNLLQKLDSMDTGLGTRIGKAYNEDGTEFSGGEQQKVAIARALYKDASVIVLDEPTSALDPLAEAEIYEQFNALVGDKTALYISHRMSSSVFCDRILILDGGTVADFDTHAALMAKPDGLYRRLFMSQAANYRLETAAAQA